MQSPLHYDGAKYHSDFAKLLVLSMVLGCAVSIFLKDCIHLASRSLGERQEGVFGIVIAGVLGIASPLCMYSTIPFSLITGGIVNAVI